MKKETQVGIFILAAIGIFLYLSINIKAFRFDKNQYHEYKTYFDDTGGIAAKASVKIAGVEIGYVEQIKLLHGGKAELVLRIDKRTKLAKNAFAMINQDGLIGTKNVEIDPGDPSTGILLPGSTLSMPGRTPTSVGELLEQFRTIATTVQDITASIKNVFATRQGEQNMKTALNAVAKATDRLADFALVLQKTMHHNEDKINGIFNDISMSVQHLRQQMPSLTNDVHTISDSFKVNSTRLADDFSTLGQKAQGTLDHVSDMTTHASDSFKEATHVFEKINAGKGTVGKLINEDETYSDLKKTIRGVKNYVHKTQSVMLNLDMHSESMIRHANTKGYFELMLRPNSDCFYTVQFVADEFGSISREVTRSTRRDAQGNILDPRSMPGLDSYGKLKFADEVERVIRKKNDVLFGLQFGKRFNRLAFRIGLFENTFGVGCDYYVPLHTDKFHWVSTFEAFDFKGYNRLDDSRPHLKWLNKLYFMKHIYTTFGIDDLYSKHNANMFWGTGIRFGDDDLKYFLSSLSFKK